MGPSPKAAKLRGILQPPASDILRRLSFVSSVLMVDPRRADDAGWPEIFPSLLRGISCPRICNASNS